MVDRVILVEYQREYIALDTTLLIWTHCTLSALKLRINSKTLLPTPCDKLHYQYIMINSVKWIWKIRYMLLTCTWFAKASKMWFWWRFVVVDFPAENPCCSFTIICVNAKLIILISICQIISRYWIEWKLHHNWIHLLSPDK